MLDGIWTQPPFVNPFWVSRQFSPRGIWMPLRLWALWVVYLLQPPHVRPEPCNPSLFSSDSLKLCGSELCRKPTGHLLCGLEASSCNNDRRRSIGEANKPCPSFPCIFWEKGKETPPRILLPTKPLKSLEKRRKNAQRNKE